MNRNTLLQSFVQDRGHYLGFLLSLSRSPERAEELFQDLSVEVIEHLDTFDATRNFPAWVRGIARNLYRKSLLDRARGQQVLLPLESRLQEALAHAYAGRTPQEEEEQREVLERLYACVRAISEKNRRLLLGRYQQNVAARDLAARCRMSTEAVHTALCRIRASLLRCVRQQGTSAP